MTHPRGNAVDFHCPVPHAEGLASAIWARTVPWMACKVPSLHCRARRKLAANCEFIRRRGHRPLYLHTRGPVAVIHRDMQRAGPNHGQTSQKPVTTRGHEPGASTRKERKERGPTWKVPAPSLKRKVREDGRAAEEAERDPADHGRQMEKV